MSNEKNGKTKKKNKSRPTKIKIEFDVKNKNVKNYKYNWKIYLVDNKLIELNLKKKAKMKLIINVNAIVKNKTKVFDLFSF